MGRPSRLDNPGILRSFAELWVKGATREQLAEQFGLGSLYTVTRWVRDPRVKAIAAQIAQDRMLHIVRKTDTELEQRLQKAGDLSTDELLKIRKEFAPATAKAGETGGHASTETETTEALEADPDLGDELEKFIEDAEAERADA